MKNSCGKRLLSMALALIMVLSMLPMSVFAEEVTDPAEAKVGDTYTGVTAPTNPKGKVWVETSSKNVSTCSGHESEHTDSCYAKTCGHDFGHTADCYEGGTDGGWVICDHEENTDGYCSCYTPVKPIKTTYYIHHGMDAETYLKTLGVPDWAIKMVLKNIGNLGIPTCTDCANKLALQILQLRFGDNIPDAYSWLSDVLALLEDAKVYDYAHYKPGEGAELTCTHVCSDACLKLVCDGHHTADCYTTVYTWTLCADENGNGVDDATENHYTVKYVDYDDSEIATYENVLVNLTTPKPENPTRTNYTFTGWNPDYADKVTADVTYKATYAPTNDENKNGIPDEEEYFTVIFQNYDGTKLQSESLQYGTTPVYKGETPVKSGYTFTGWDKNIARVTENATYIATFSNTANTHTVSFYYYTDGEAGNTEGAAYQLWTTANVAYGTEVTYANLISWGKVDGKDPAVEGYTFKGWADKAGSTTGFTMPDQDVTVVAVFQKNTYTITWNDENGTVLDTAFVAYGDTPVYDGATPAKTATAQYTYTWTGWQNGEDTYTTTAAFPAATANTTYTATYSSTVNKYTITWKDTDGTVLYSEDVAYGETPVYGGTEPSRPNYTYSWEPTVVAVTGAATYTLKWTPNTDDNNNGVDDSEETITVEIVGNGSVTVNRKKFTTNGTMVYDSTTVTEITVVTKADDGNYLTAYTVDDKEGTDSFAANGCHTIAVTFGAMAITAHDGEMNKVGVEDKSSDELVAEIKTATEMATTPERIAEDVVTEYLAFSYTIPTSWPLVGGKVLEYWAVPGEALDLSSALGDLSKYIPKDAIPHNFGAQDEETVRFTYTDGKVDVQAKAKITLKDLRIETSLQGQNAQVVYKSYTTEDLLTEIAPKVTTADGKTIEGATVTIETDIIGKNVGEYEVELSYEGDDTYKPCTTTVTVNVVKAPVTITVESQTGKYGVSAFNPNPISTDPDGVKHIDLVVGLDAHDETNLTYTAQVVLPMNSKLVEALKGRGIDLSGELTLDGLNSLLKSLVDVMDNEIISGLLGGFGIDMDTVNTIIKALDAILEYLPEGAQLKIKVAVELELPENVGAYVIGSVTADSNYETALGVGYLIITPNGVRVNLDWTEKDDNGILTLLKYNDFDLSAYGTVVEGTLEGATEDDLDGTADSHIRYLFLGVDKDLNLIVDETLAKDAKAGAYVEVAYLTNWDNVMYYAAPIARTLVLVPSIAEVTFVDESGKENNDRLFDYDGNAKSMAVQVKVNGEVVTPAADELTVTYVGIDGHAKGYNNTVAPTEAGAYAVYAVYVQRTNGEVTAAGCAVGAMVIRKVTPEFSLSDNTVYCGDGESFAAVTNPNGLDYFSVAIGGGKAYVNLPADWEEHVSKLPECVQEKINALVENADGMNNAQLLEALNDVIAALNSVNKSEEAAKVLEAILEEIQGVSSENIQNQIVKQLETLKKELGDKIPDEVVDMMKKLFGAVSSADAEAIKAKLLSEIDKLDLPEEVKAQLKTMVEELADKVSSNEELTAAIAQLKDLLKNIDLPTSKEIAEALTGYMTGAIDKAAVIELLEKAIGQLNTCAQVKEKLEALRSELSKYEFTVVMGHNPEQCGEYDCYAVNVSANYVSVLAKAALTIEHKFDNGVVTDPTCTEKGYTTYTCICKCDHCADAAYTDNEVPALGHNPREAVEENRVEATCTEDGSYDLVVYCDRCEEELSRTHETIPATGHDWGDWEKHDDDQHMRVCKNDSSHVEYEDHNWGEGVVTTPATCEKEGEMTYTCTVCGETKTDSIEALGHNWGDWEEHDDDQHMRVCKNDSSHVEYEDHNWGEGVVTTPATCECEGEMTYTCDDCGATMSDSIEALGHDMGNWYQVVAPGYGTKGLERRNCKRVGCNHYEVRDIAPLVKPGTTTPSEPTVNVKGLDTVNHVAYIVGRDTGLVDPNGTITRAEVATIYFRLMTDSFRNRYWSDSSSYVDVDSTAWYNVAVATLENAGIIKDTRSGGSFRPNEPITRAELAVMAAQFCTVTGNISKSSFSDVPTNHWAASEIALVEYAGWIEGFEGKFRPDDSLSRAECVTIVNRMLNRGAEAENMLSSMVTFTDNTYGAWYYEAIQEAANSHTYTRTSNKLTGENFYGEKWVSLLDAPDWAALEKSWAKANQN